MSLHPPDFFTQELRALVRSSRPELPLPRDFNSQVWVRIAAQEESPADRIRERVLAGFRNFTRPLPAAWACSVLILLGAVAIGLWQSEWTQGNHVFPPEENYLVSIDPYAQALRGSAP